MKKMLIGYMLFASIPVFADLGTTTVNDDPTPTASFSSSSAESSSYSASSSSSSSGGSASVSVSKPSSAEISAGVTDVVDWLAQGNS